MKAYVEQLMDYNNWANGLILKYAEKLPEGQYLELISYSQKKSCRYSGAYPARGNPLAGEDAG